MSGAIIGTCEPRCNRKTSTERRCRAPRTAYAMRDGIRFSLTWSQCDITMQSAAARTARGFASSPSQSGARRRGRHANAGAVMKGTHNERGKATQGQVGLRHARRRGGGAHRHHRPLYLEHHRAREHTRRRRRARSLRMGARPQHPRVLPVVHPAQRILLAAARPGARVHPVRQVRGHRPRRGLLLGQPVL